MKKKMLVVKNLSISFEGKSIFDDISFSLDYNSITALLCPNNSGKTLLIKTLSGILSPNSGKIILNDSLFSKNKYTDYILHISTILEDIDNQFLCDIVIDEISFPLHNLGYDGFYISNAIKEISQSLDISNILYKKTSNLNSFEKVLVLIAASIAHKPNILFIDDVMRFLNNNEKKKILKIFETIKDKYGISILFTTSDINDIIGISRVLVVNNGHISFDDSFENIIMKDNDLSKMGFKIPIMIDLSRKLQFYNLLDDICYSRDEVVDKIWK